MGAIMNSDRLLWKSECDTFGKRLVEKLTEGIAFQKTSKTRRRRVAAYR
ncbi:hypothetical protein [Nostoc sp.]